MLSLITRCQGFNRASFNIITMGIITCMLMYMYYLHSEMIRMDAKIAMLSNQHQMGGMGDIQNDLVRHMQGECDIDFSSLINPDGYNITITSDDTAADDGDGDGPTMHVINEDDDPVNEVVDAVDDAVDAAVAADAADAADAVDAVDGEDALKYDDLKRKLKKLGADTRGTKAVLQQRLSGIKPA
jgi:hypothetical protein